MRYAIALTLNAIDGILTAVGMAMGFLSEANPLLASFSAIGILLIKLLPVSGLIVGLYYARTYAFARIGTLLVCGVYLHILYLHISWLTTIG